MMSETIRLWLPIGVSVAFFAWNIWLYRSGARKQQTDKLEARVSGLAAELAEHKEAGSNSRAELRERLGQVEQTLKQMPDKEAVHSLALAVTEIRGDLREQGATMRAMDGSLKAVAASGQRIEDYLLKAASK